MRLPSSPRITRALFDVFDMRPSATTFQLPAELHTLDFGYDGIGAVLEWLLSLSVRPALRTVCLISIRDEDLAAVHKFIRVFGNSLESFGLASKVQDCMRTRLLWSRCDS